MGEASKLGGIYFYTEVFVGTWLSCMALRQAVGYLSDFEVDFAAWPFPRLPSFIGLREARMKSLKALLCGLVIFCSGCTSSYVRTGGPVSLSEDTYKADLGVLIFQVNWGRVWRCGQFENAQLQSLTFTKSPIDVPEPVSLNLETPSKLFVDNQFLPYVLVIQPGEYVLTGFDVKIARSVSGVGHIKGSKDNLIKDGRPIGGTFTVNPGEVVYVGHFGLDCGAEPFLWRSYIQDREDFERYIGGFRKKFPFMEQVPVHYRLFSTELLGRPFALKDPIVK